MHFQIRMRQNLKKNIFRDKQSTNKVPMIFLNVKVLTETYQLAFWSSLTKNECTVYVFSI